MDESTGQSVVAYLRAEGHDVEAVAERMRGAPDGAVLALAVSEDRILITNDKDFGELVFREGREHRGILLLRPQDDRRACKMALMQEVLARVADRLKARYVVATERGIRVRG